MDFERLFEPDILIVWVVVGVLAGTIGRMIIYRNRSGGGTFGSLVQACALGMLGSLIGVGIGSVLELPGATELGPMMLVLSVIGTLGVIFLVSKITS